MTDYIVYDTDYTEIQALAQGEFYEVKAISGNDAKYQVLKEIVPDLVALSSKKGLEKYVYPTLVAIKIESLGRLPCLFADQIDAILEGKIDV